MKTKKNWKKKLNNIFLITWKHRMIELSYDKTAFLFHWKLKFLMSLTILINWLERYIHTNKKSFIPSKNF